MGTYIIRRILLMIPTFIGITMIAYSVMWVVPGGPVEQAILQYQASMQGMGGGEVSSGGDTTAGGSTGISEEMVQELKAIYGFDKPIYIAYLNWLGKVVQCDLGESWQYQKPVWDLIKSRFPVSLFFGGTGFILAYLICIPLGVWKAVRHQSLFDWSTSALVFAAYSIPGFAAGVVLLVLFGGGTYWDVFPLGGLHSMNYEDLTFWGKVADRARHSVLPIFCYVLPFFATTTVLMKNSLMENLAQDYVRTAFAKGLNERVVIFKHALRNSLIPIATGLGHFFSILLAGSYLIEKVFNIHGFGLLGYGSLLARDYPVTLGILVISSILRLIGNLTSDMIYAVVDPRIRFK
jgi:microcin C transport system permease protein